jgi:tetratricopeptide (TPR) repeat protein
VGACVDEELQEWEVLELLTALVEKSLVQYEAGGAEGGADDRSREGEARYRLLETVRQYARERLIESGEAEPVRDRHLTFFLQFAERAEPELHRQEQIDWLDRLEREHDNLRAALDWSLKAVDSSQWSVVSPADGDPTAAPPLPTLSTIHYPPTTTLRLAGALTWLWLKRNHFAEGRQWLEQAVSRSSNAPKGWRVKALQGLGIIARFCGDQEASRSALEESLTLARDAGDQSATAYLLVQLGVQASWQNDFRRAQRLGEESLAVARGVGDAWTMAHPLHLLGLVTSQQGDGREAIRLFEESLRLTRAVGDKFHMAMTLGFLATQMGLAGRDAEARQLHLEEITLGQELKDKRIIAWGLEALSWVGSAGGQAECPRTAWVQSARLMGTAEAMIAPSPLLLPPARRSLHDHTAAAARAALGEEAFAAAWAEGRAMSLEQAVSYALGNSLSSEAD